MLQTLTQDMVKNRLTNEEFKQFWVRMKKEIRVQIYASIIIFVLLPCLFVLFIHTLIDRNDTKQYDKHYFYNGYSAFNIDSSSYE